jgi:hypothetical protein
MKRRSARVIDIAGLGSMCVLAGLALWPAPGKYPFLLPGVLALGIAFGAYRRRYHAALALTGEAEAFGRAVVVLAAWSGRLSVTGRISVGEMERRWRTSPSS